MREKSRKRWEQCDKVEAQIEKVIEGRKQMAIEIEERKQRIQAEFESADAVAAAATAEAMEVEQHARKEEEQAQECRKQLKTLEKEVKELTQEIEKRKVPPMSEAKLRSAETSLEQTTKECKELEQKDASMKLEIRQMKRKIEKLEELIKKKEEEAEEEAAKNPPKGEKKGRKSCIQKGKKDLADVDADADPDLLPYQMRMRHPDKKEEFEKKRLTTLFSDARGQAARQTQLRNTVAAERKTVVGAQLEAMGTAAEEDYPTVGETGAPISPSSPLLQHDGERLGLMEGMAEFDHEAKVGRKGMPKSRTTITARRYDKNYDDDVDLKLAAAQRRLKCTSDRLEKMASKEARLRADLGSCVMALHRWIEQEEKQCGEVTNELNEMVSAFSPLNEAQEKAKERLQKAVEAYYEELRILHTRMETAEEGAQAGREIDDKEERGIDAANKKVKSADKEVCDALKEVQETSDEGFRKLVKGCLNSHMDMEKQVDETRTRRLETREGVTSWGKLLAQEREEVKRARRERLELMNKEKILEHEAAMIDIELEREAQVVAGRDDVSIAFTATNSTNVARMNSTQSHNLSSRSLSPNRSLSPRSSVQLEKERLQRMKVVPHGVSSNAFTGMQMESSIPAKPPKGNKKSLFPCLVKKEPCSWEEEPTRAHSVSTTATFYDTSTTSFGTSYSTSFGNTPEVSREGQRQMLVRHLSEKKMAYRHWHAGEGWHSRA